MEKFNTYEILLVVIVIVYYIINILLKKVIVKDIEINSQKASPLKIRSYLKYWFVLLQRDDISIWSKVIIVIYIIFYMTIIFIVASLLIALLISLIT